MILGWNCHLLFTPSPLHSDVRVNPAANALRQRALNPTIPHEEAGSDLERA
jgi:hypothetical protein